MLKKGDTASYYGKLVVITDVRRVPGGTVADVKRHESEGRWPWPGLRSFSTNIEVLEPVED